MPDANLPDDTVITSSFYNTYIREQVVVTCTSATRPTGVTGRLIYETDTKTFSVYNGSAWMPASATQSWLATRTTDAGPFTVVTDIAGLSITFTAIAGRRYRVHAELYMESTSSGDVGNLALTTGASVQVNSAQVLLTPSATPLTVACTAFVVPGAGSATYKVRTSRFSGAGNLMVRAGVTYPSFISIEDVGPT